MARQRAAISRRRFLPFRLFQRTRLGVVHRVTRLAKTVHDSGLIDDELYAQAVGWRIRLRQWISWSCAHDSDFLPTQSRRNQVAAYVLGSQAIQLVSFVLVAKRQHDQPSAPVGKPARDVAHVRALNWDRRAPDVPLIDAERLTEARSSRNPPPPPHAADGSHTVLAIARQALQRRPKADPIRSCCQIHGGRFRGRTKKRRDGGIVIQGGRGAKRRDCSPRGSTSWIASVIFGPALRQRVGGSWGRRC